MVEGWVRVIAVGLALMIAIVGCSRPAHREPEMDAGADGAPRLMDRIPDQFATAGQSRAVVDLRRYYPGLKAARIVEGPSNAVVRDGALQLTPSAPQHASVLIELTAHGESLRDHFWYAVQPQKAPSYPLQVSRNNRYLVDAAGDPVVIHGDAAWELPTNTTEEEARTYFDDRQQRGMTAGIWRIITTAFTDQRPFHENAYGEPPFTSTVGDALNFTAPNEAYWQYVDWCIREAYKHGYLVFAAPAYIGYNNGNQGWTEALLANGPRRMRAYGRWLGSRYAAYPNIIWVAGGDSELREEAPMHDAMMDGLVAGEAEAAGRPVHLVTAKSKRERSALDDYDYPWLTVNATYSKTTAVASRVHDDYSGHDRVLPTVLIEGWYENEHGMTPLQLRQQAYWALLEGAAGHIFGNCPVWSFGGAPWFCDDQDRGVEASYDSEGAESMQHLSALLSTRTLLHDEGGYLDVDQGELVTAGKGTPGTAAYVAARYNGRTAVVYLPQEKPITVDLSRLDAARGTVRAVWYDPSTGTVTTDGWYAPAGLRTMAPPGSGDWVLLLDDAALDVPLPGSGS